MAGGARFGKHCPMNSVVVGECHNRPALSVPGIRSPQQIGSLVDKWRKERFLLGIRVCFYLAGPKKWVLYNHRLWMHAWTSVSFAHFQEKKLGHLAKVLWK